MRGDLMIRVSVCTIALLIAVQTQTAHAQAFVASFSNARGNAWWVETDITANQVLAAVSARADGGPWMPLAATTWGSWAGSFLVATNGVVEFQARNAAGATAVSGKYAWPSATPIAS